MEEKKLNGFNNWVDRSDGVGGMPPFNNFPVEETKTAEEIIAKVIRENITNLDSEITPKELILICSKAMEEYANLRLPQQQEINAELQEKLTCIQHTVNNKSAKISELKKQNEELVDRLTKAESIIKSYYARIDHDDPANRNQIDRLQKFIQNTPPKN